MPTASRDVAAFSGEEKPAGCHLFELRHRVGTRAVITTALR